MQYALFLFLTRKAPIMSIQSQRYSRGFFRSLFFNPALPILLPIFACGFLCVSCQWYVQGTPSPVDLIGNQDLADEAQLPLVYTGVGGSFASSIHLLTAHASILSDEFQSANGISQDRTQSDIFNLDDGFPIRTLTNESWGRIAATRFHANNALALERQIAFTQESNRKKLLFTANFFLGTAEHYLAAFFALSARRGGGVIDGSPFIPSKDLHDSALVKYARALESAQTPFERRLTRSFMARIHLLEGRFSEALQEANQGLQEGDTAFVATYSRSSYNRWTDFAGINLNHTVIPHPRFRAYIVAEAGEAGRIPLKVGKRPAAGRAEPYYIQAKYDDDSPIELMTWQENALMLAELRLRLFGDEAGALAEINRVRAAAPAAPNAPPLAPRLAANLDSVYIERDKQLFATGLRLLDQRRFNRWHFANAAAAWHFLPIAQNEFISNPNLQGQ
jgi:hypothetical protein